MEFRFKFNFKDGYTATTTTLTDFNESAGILSLLQHNLEQDNPIVLGSGEEQVTRKFSELHSFEIIIL